MLLLISSILLLLYMFKCLTLGKTKSSTCLIGKTAIITGANSGLGYQTALNLASRGCRIIMADIDDMENSKNNIKKYTNNTNIVAKTIDLASLKSVREFAQDILATEDRLDILVNNAGVAYSDKVPTSDGLNKHMQINYFGHFLLTHLLVPLLKKSAPSRVVFTSSLMAFLNNLSVSNLNYDLKKEPYVFKGYSDLRIYSNSKFAMIIASDIYAEKLKPFGVTFNSLHPGFVKTRIYKEFQNGVSSFPVCLLIPFRRYFFKDIWEGAQTMTHIAISKKLENVSGKWFWDCIPFIKPYYAYNRKFCDDIWKMSEELVQLNEYEKL